VLVDIVYNESSNSFVWRRTGSTVLDEVTGFENTVDFSTGDYCVAKRYGESFYNIVKCDSLSSYYIEL